MANKKYTNRELSWLSFNARVLQEAADETVPLIERLRFLGIFSNNLDEFFKVRYATVKRIDLAGKAARAGDLTVHSLHEQSSVGLDRLSDEEYDRFTRLNDTYKETFGFPFIIAVLDHTKASILAAFEDRLKGDRGSQIDGALKNIGCIVSLRVLGTVTE